MSLDHDVSNSAHDDCFNTHEPARKWLAHDDPSRAIATTTGACSGLLNADQHLGHLRFSSQILAVHFLDRATWLLLAPKAWFWELAGTISGTLDGRLCPTAGVHRERSSFPWTRRDLLPVCDALVMPADEPQATILGDYQRQSIVDGLAETVRRPMTRSDSIRADPCA